MTGAVQSNIGEVACARADDAECRIFTVPKYIRRFDERVLILRWNELHLQQETPVSFGVWRNEDKKTYSREHTRPGAIPIGGAHVVCIKRVSL